ncbi:MAG TPA: endolytic transglycosylase MltG, partial [Solirubrobacteraceae bacterium]|nr:endolytic transglycosylase MltG [Solirubrobacteraceae bacterium]
MSDRTPEEREAARRAREARRTGRPFERAEPPPAIDPPPPEAPRAFDPSPPEAPRAFDPAPPEAPRAFDPPPPERPRPVDPPPPLDPPWPQADEPPWPAAGPPQFSGPLAWPSEPGDRDGQADGDGDGDLAEDPEPYEPAPTRKRSAARRPPPPRAKRPTRPPRSPDRPPGERSRARSLAPRIVAVVALVLALAAIWFLVELFQPFNGSGHGSAVVTVPAGASTSTIGDELSRKGVISSSFFFGLRATLEGDRGKLRAGTYHLKLGMGYGAVLSILTTPPPAA